MGCGASSPAAAGKQAKTPSPNDEVVEKIRAVSEFGEDAPLAIGALTIFETKQQNVKEQFVFGKVLGKGQFGTCRLVTEKATGTRYACKSIAKRRLATLGDVEDVRREVQIMHHLAGHPNIVMIKDVFEDRSHVHLVEELCSGGELFDSIVERGHYSERDAANVFRCIAAVIAHCHNMGVMHRDIKPENFLLSNRSKYAIVKGTDFGLSCFFSEGQLFNEVVGSAFYVAPEVLRKKYDKRADIWSLGVLLYILLCGMPPFYAETEKDIFHAILSAELSFSSAPWPSISEAAKDVIRRMLERNPARRATAAEVLQHEWVRENGSAAAAPLNNEVLHRLQNFAALNKLQQEALKVIATHLPENEISGLKALFMEMDADGSGTITVDELREALRKKGTKIPAAELERIMAQADISGDGTLDYEEFLAATMNLAKLEHEEHLYMAFRFFDTDDSGYITRDELVAALHRVCGEDEIDALLQQADSSGDGRIDYEEFCDLMRGGNAALVKATKTVKQGLMRTVRSQAVLDLEALTAVGPEPTVVMPMDPNMLSAPSITAHTPPGSAGAAGAGSVTGSAAAAGGAGGDSRRSGVGGAAASGSGDSRRSGTGAGAASGAASGVSHRSGGAASAAGSAAGVRQASGSSSLPPIARHEHPSMRCVDADDHIDVLHDAEGDHVVVAGGPNGHEDGPQPRRLVHTMSRETEQHCKGALAMLEHPKPPPRQPSRQPVQQQREPSQLDLAAMAAVSFTVGG